MDENLVGYILEVLDPETQQAVADYLHETPEAQQRLERLKQALAPLEADKEPIEPPPLLAIRTISRLAEYKCQKPRSEPEIPVLRAPPVSAWAEAPRTWWRRADLLVAASILLGVALLIPPSLHYLQYRQAVSACQDNLRVMYTALNGYSDKHDGALPNVAVATSNPRRNVAGMVVPVLYQEGLLGDNFSSRCPSNGSSAFNSPNLAQIESMSDEEFERRVHDLSGCYAYSLGFRDGNATQGHRLDKDEPNAQYLPIMADRPPVNVAFGDTGNSPNHAGRGQNILYSDGHVIFSNTRHAGLNKDDIYLNNDHEVAAGKHRWDAVLGESKSRPEK